MPLLETLDPQAEAILRARTDPWWFLSQCVFTLDEADKWQPIKRYPSDRLYLKWLVEQILKETLLALVKSRRMLVTWTACGLALHEAMFFEGRFNALVSKKEEDSDELVRRCKFIYDNIPEGVLPVKPRAEYKYTQLSFPEIESRIKGVPQGADQLRQYTCSRIFAEEIAFWPQARESFTGMKPTLEGGGKICLVSTRYPGFFKELIEDKLDPEETPKATLASGPEAPLKVPKVGTPMEGVKEWTNAKNGFRVIDLSYKADPEKRSAQWLASSQSGIAKSLWDREYGDVWVVYEGKPVYQSYNEERHLYRGDIIVPRRSKLISGWDAGPNDVNLAWALGVIIPDELGVIWIDEYGVDDGDAEDFVQVVGSRLRLEWLKLGGFSLHVADQSIFTKSSISQSSVADIMRKHGIYPIPGEISFAKRRASVEELLSKYGKFYVHERCTVIREGMKGGYCYSKVATAIGGQYKETPVKNKFSHLINAVEYGCSRLYAASVDVPYEGRPLPLHLGAII